MGKYAPWLSGFALFSQVIRFEDLTVMAKIMSTRGLIRSDSLIIDLIDLGELKSNKSRRFIPLPDKWPKIQGYVVIRLTDASNSRNHFVQQLVRCIMAVCLNSGFFLAH